MYRYIGVTFFFQILLALTISENNWFLFDIPLAPIVYFLIILESIYLNLKTNIKSLIYYIFIFIILLICYYNKFTYKFELLEDIYRFAFQSFFLMVGIYFYKEKQDYILKNIVLYILLCIPFMLIQIIGIDYHFYGWVTDYLHSKDIMSLEDIGKFNEIPLYPTVFVHFEDLIYSIVQGRPAGLMYASNILGIFIALGIVMNISYDRNKNLNFSDLVLSVSAVLSMSKFVFFIQILYFALYFIFGFREKKILILKLILLNVTLLAIYFFIFPGLAENNLSTNMILSALMIRLADFLSAIGYDLNTDLISTLMYEYRLNENYVFVPGNFSLNKLISEYRSYLLILIPGLFLFLWKLKVTTGSLKFPIYMNLFIVLVLIQTSFSFYSTAAIQILIGFVLSPLLDRSKNV